MLELFGVIQLCLLESKQFWQLFKVATEKELQSKEIFFTDEENYNFALIVFEKEEGRKPNMNNTNDMNTVAMLEVGIRYARL